jgi:hypothetical protein
MTSEAAPGVQAVLGKSGNLILKISSSMAKIIIILFHHQRKLLVYGKPSD